MSTKLEQKVDSLETKVHAYERSENLEEQVNQACAELKEYNREVRNLNRRLEDLAHFVGILETIFERERPESVTELHRGIDDVTQRRQEDILRLLEKGELSEKRSEVRDFQEFVKSSMDNVQEEIKTSQQEWERRISTARAVLKIAGGSPSFQNVLNDLESFLNQDIWDTSEKVTSLDAHWQGLTKAWEKESVDWETFEQRHKLNEKTTATLQKLSRGETIKIGNIDAEVLQDMSRVRQLGNNIELTI